MDKTLKAGQEKKGDEVTGAGGHENQPGGQVPKAGPAPNPSSDVSQPGPDRALSKEEKSLATAYKDLYEVQNAIPHNPLDVRTKQDSLQKALEENGKANMEKNKKIAKDLSNGSRTEKARWIRDMIADINGQLDLLNQGLASFYKTNTASPAITEVVAKDIKTQGGDKSGELVATRYAEADDQFADTSELVLDNTTTSG